MCEVELMSLNSKSLGAENPHFYFKVAMTVLVLELTGGKKIFSFLISLQNLIKVS